ncbi:hypothetical protein STAWA0001_0335, partial [Staphylococcus warneri L37603]
MGYWVIGLLASFFWRVRRIAAPIRTVRRNPARVLRHGVACTVYGVANRIGHQNNGVSRHSCRLTWDTPAFPMARLLPREVALAAAAVCLSAQAADPSPEVHELAPVTVHAAGQTALDEPASTGSNLGLTPMQTPASVEVIARDQLEVRGDVSLVDAITRAPGLSGLGHPG